MDTAGALEHQELMSEGKNLSLQRCSSLKSLPSRRKQRENDPEHVAEKLQRRLPKFNQFSQNGVFGRHKEPGSSAVSRTTGRPAEVLREGSSIKVDGTADHGLTISPLNDAGEFPWQKTSRPDLSATCVGQ
jgi:hypothetical protein